MTDRIDRFEGKYFFLSNFYACPVTYKGLEFKSSEAAYQAQKCADKSKKELFTDLTPDEAKGFGKHVALVDGWDDMKADVMRQVVHAKFSQNPGLAKRLLETGDAELVEGNTWHDNFFGSCTCPACRTKRGENWLGLILMDERDRLKEEAIHNALKEMRNGTEKL